MFSEAKAFRLREAETGRKHLTWLGWRDSNPRGDGVKVRCLTAWRQPNIRYPKSIAYFRPLVKRFKQRKAVRKQVFLLRTAHILL